MWGFQSETKVVLTHAGYLVWQSGAFLGLKVPWIPAGTILRKQKGKVGMEGLCESTQAPSTVPQIQLQLEKLRNVKGGL